MKRNRILAIGIALLLAVQLLTPLACAAGTTLKLTAPDKLPDVGQTFTVTAELTGNTGLAAVQLSLGYDDSVVECTGIENGALVAGMLAASNPYATRDGVGAILAAATTTAVKTDGSLAVFTFRVKAAGDAKLTLADALLSDIDGKALSLSYSLPALIAQGSGSDSGSGSGSDAEKPGADDKKSDNDKKSEDDKKSEEEQPADAAQEEVRTGSFRDVTSAHWAFASVERAAEMGLVTGYSNGTFRPDTAVTRAQFVLMLWRMCGKPAAAKAASFADASADWYQDALSWAVEKGYVNGLSGTRFGPDAPITRQQAMAILFRLNGGQSGTELTLTGIYEQTFADSTTIAAWAKDATWWAVYHELVSGVGGQPHRAGGQRVPRTDRGDPAAVCGSIYDNGGSGMKRRMLALLLAVLTLTMLTAAAFAEDTEVLGVYNVTGPLTVKNGTKDGGFYAGADTFELNCTGLTGEYSLVLLLAGDSAVPTEGNIQYIDQTSVKAGKVTFTLKPKALTEGTYNVYISTTDKALDKVASFKYGEKPEYTLGDVNGDGKVSAYDASMILQHTVGLIDLAGVAAADVNKDGKISAYDASMILQYTVGLITLD